MTDVITLDLETTSLDPTSGKILLTGYQINGKDFTQMDGFPDPKSSVLGHALGQPDNILRGHHITFDALFLANNAFEIKCQFEDTRVLAYLNWPEAASHSLKALVRERLCGNPTELSDIQFEPLKRDVKYLDPADYYSFADGKLVRRDLLRVYHEADIRNVDHLRSILRVPEWFTQVEQPLTRMLFEMELYGAPLDGNVLDKLLQRYHDRLDEHLASLRSKTSETFNPNSSDQVRDFLTLKGYNLEEICEKTKGGAYSVNAPLLKSLAWKGDEFARTLLEYRKYSKLLSTYVEPFREGCKLDGRLHGSINQAGSEDMYGEGAKGTNTGRLSSSNPNLQNIPSRTKEGKEVRRAFVATSGWHMFDSDLSQIEPRLVAHYSQAPKLINAYANNLDTHGIFANDIFGRQCSKDSIERFIGKTSWLATVYGCSYKKLLLICEGYSDSPLTMDTTNYKAAFDNLDFKQKKKVVKECGQDYRKIYEQWMFFKDVQKRFEATNPEIFDWRRTHIARTKRLGYIVTFGGRRIGVSGLDSSDFGERLSAERKAVNYLVQGSAADISKIIMLELNKQIVLTGKGRLFAVVHDEFLGELRNSEDKDLVHSIISNTCSLRNVRIAAETKLCKSWADK